MPALTLTTNVHLAKLRQLPLRQTVLLCWLRQRRLLIWRLGPSHDMIACMRRCAGLAERRAEFYGKVDVCVDKLVAALDTVQGDDELKSRRKQKIHEAERCGSCPPSRQGYGRYRAAPQKAAWAVDPPLRGRPTPMMPSAHRSIPMEGRMRLRRIHDRSTGRRVSRPARARGRAPRVRIYDETGKARESAWCVRRQRRKKQERLERGVSRVHFNRFMD